MDFPKKLVTLDNGDTYLLQKSKTKGYAYDLIHQRKGIVLNSLKEHYLEDCIKYDSPFCFNITDKNEIQYARIKSIEDLRQTQAS